MTMADPTLARTISAAAAATVASSVVTATLVVIRSRRTRTAVAPGLGRLSVTAAHLVQFAVVVRCARAG